MKVFVIILFTLVYIISSARSTTSVKPFRAPVSLPPPVTVKPPTTFPDKRLLLPHPVLTQPARDDPLQQLFETNPLIESDPSVLLDRDQPYPDINHVLTPASANKKPTLALADPSTDASYLVAPSAVGRPLGTSGRETHEFRRKCFECCKVSKKAFKSWPKAPTKRCNVCKMNVKLNPKKKGKCKEGKFLGYYDTPSPCFFERCHQMLFYRTGSCMCFSDNASLNSGGAVLAS